MRFILTVNLPSDPIDYLIISNDRPKISNHQALQINSSCKTWSSHNPHTGILRPARFRPRNDIACLFLPVFRRKKFHHLLFQFLGSVPCAMPKRGAMRTTCRSTMIIFRITTHFTHNYVGRFPPDPRQRCQIIQGFGIFLSVPDDGRHLQKPLRLFRKFLIFCTRETRNLAWPGIMFSYPETLQRTPGPIY